MKDEAFKVVEQREEMEKVKAVEIDPLWVDVQVEVIDTFLLQPKTDGEWLRGPPPPPQYLVLISSKFLDNLS